MIRTFLWWAGLCRQTRTKSALDNYRATPRHACRCRSGRGHSFLRRNYLSREPEDDSISRAHFVLENAILWWLMFPKGPPSNDRIPKSFNPGLDVRDFNGGLQIGVDARNPNFKSRSD